MRVTLIFLFIFLGLVHANDFKAQNTIISIEANNEKISEVLDEIEQKTDYYFFYNNKEVDVNQTVSVHAKEKKVRDVLDMIFGESDILYSMLDNSIILSNKAVVSSIARNISLLQAQAGSVKGIVKDIHGVPLIGVSVLVKGTTTGTVTDSDGAYTLSAPDNVVLIFSYIGYIPQEVSSQGRSTIDITLLEDLQQLEEVVVVGYGVQKKVNLTGSVSVIKYDQEMENRPITNASQALSGKTAGVWVSQNSGAPGSDGASIRIRGYGTLNNTDPLVLIDGIEGRLAELNPNDIESITVLKDAASAAIYGSRAANGVILVETRKGKGDEKVTVNYNGYVGLQQLGMRYNIISNSAEIMEIWNRATINNGGSAIFPDDVIAGFKNGTDPYRYPNTNYFDEVFRPAFITQQNLSTNISSKRGETYLSLSYLNQDGIVKNTESERIGLTINNTTKINNWFSMGARARVMRKVTSQPYEGISRVIYMMANGHPFTTPYLQDGKTFGGTQALYVSGPNAGAPIVDTRNPFPDLYNGLDQYTNNFYKANVFATIEFMKGLTLTGQYSGQYNNNLRDRYNQLNYCYTDLEGSNKSAPLDYPSTLNIFRSDNDEYYSTFFANLNFNRTFANIHDISAMLGVQTEDFLLKTMDAQKSSPAKEDLHQVTTGTTNPIANGGKAQWRMLSYFGRVNYALMSKYLFEVNLRADGSSRFAKENRWGYFPSFSAAWRLSEEHFIKNMGLFDNLKLRASWGQLGNNNIGTSGNNWPYLVTINQTYGTSYNFAGQLAPGAAITAMVDPDITWETTTTTDIGLDFGFLGNRLSFETDYFERETKDIIVQLPIPITLGGLTAPYENVGKMSNKGFELTANWQDDLKDSGLKYGLGLNFTYVDNKVTKFRGGKSPDQLYLIREGYSYKTLYGYQSEGIYQTNEEAAQHMHSNSYVPVAGDIKYKDVNGDGKLGYEDKGEIGNTIPKITYGLNGNLSWKGFDLSFLFQGIAKVHGFYKNAWTEPLGISGGTVTEKWRDAWTPENKSTELPRIRINDTWNRYESSFWACDLSWFKLKNLQLGYSIPKHITNRWAIGNLYFYLNATNVFTVVSSEYEGFDPERDTFSDGYNQYPTPRVYSFGMNLTF